MCVFNAVQIMECGGPKMKLPKYLYEIYILVECKEYKGREFFLVQNPYMI